MEEFVLKTNRYVVAFAGVMFHLMIGSVYAWSVFTNPIAKQNGWAESSVALAFSIAIFFLGMSAAFMGKVVEKIGPRLTGTIASFLYGTGTIMTGWAIHQNSIWLLYLSYGVIGGLGLGAGYVTPVSTIIKWFPDKRGLATGLAIMGFGFAAMLTGPVAQQLMASVGLEQTFYLLGTFYFVIMLLAAQFIVRPNLALSNTTENSISQKKGTRLTRGCVQRAGAELAGQLSKRQALCRKEGHPSCARRICGRERLPAGRLDLEPPRCPQGPA